jgi:hypothetical protein
MQVDGSVLRVKDGRALVRRIGHRGDHLRGREGSQLNVNPGRWPSV